MAALCENFNGKSQLRGGKQVEWGEEEKGEIESSFRVKKHTYNNYRLR
jgi:hypothetical protein